MNRIHVHTLLPTLLMALLIGKLTLINQQSVTEPAPAAPELPYAPICGFTHVGGIPGSLLTQPVALRSNIGQFPTPTSTKSPKAQEYFEQGMAYLHGYSLVEAARSFHEALKQDSTFVMAHVSLSRLYIQLEDNKAALKAAETAQSLANYASAREKAHIELRFAQLKAVDSLSNQKLLNEYRNKVNAAVKKFPTDLELWLLSGNSYEKFATGRGQGSSTASIAIYEKVLQMAPNHPSAHHFLIHAYEGMSDYGKALEHGKAYARLAPNLAHALHMYAHDLMKTGDVDRAIAEMKQTDAIERDLYRSEKYDPMYDWHHIHNISLLALCYQYQGRIGEAEKLVKERFETKRPINQERTFYNKMGYPTLLISQNRYAEATPIATELTRGKTPGERVIGHYLLGLMALKKNQLEAARTSLKASQTELVQAKNEAHTDWLNAWLDPHPKFLAALIALHDPNGREKGLADIRKFQTSARDQTGPDPWIEALFQLEMIAQVAYQLELNGFAEEAARVLAEHDPAYPGTHFALARIADRKGDKTTANREYQLARQGWSKADAAFLAQNFPKK
ncbi:tetratricopeptide repeat protein [Larkinella arboricola]